MATAARPEFPPNGLTLVSLFAGCGGSSLGYHMAGYDVRLAVDFDEECERIYRANFPSTPFIRRDIRELSGEEALRAAGVREGELDVLDGSPPCQGFSTAGKRRLQDPRNTLFEEYARMVRAFRPRALVMENVSGLRKGKMRLVFAAVTSSLKACGYRVSCRELNAWWWGVPQDRRRLIWVGIREDLGAEPSHPQPTARVPLSVAKAIGDGKLLDNKPGYRMREFRQNKVAATMRVSCAPEIVEDVSIAGSFSFPRNAERDGRTTDRQVGTLAAIRPPHVAIRSGAYRADTRLLTRQAPTLGVTKPDVMDSGVIVRQITVGEAKVLQGFPEWFEIDVYWPIGNSVAPPMAEAVGRHVASLLAGVPRG